MPRLTSLWCGFGPIMERLIAAPLFYIYECGCLHYYYCVCCVYARGQIVCIARSSLSLSGSATEGIGGGGGEGYLAVGNINSYFSLGNPGRV